MVKNTRADEIVKTITGVRGSSGTREPARDAIDGSDVGPPPAAAGPATLTAAQRAGLQRSGAVLAASAGEAQWWRIPDNTPP